MRKRRWIAAIAAAALLAGACSNDSDDTEASGDTGGEEEPADIEGGLDSEFFSQEEMDAQLAMRDIEPECPADAPWEQAIQPTWVDTAQYAKPGGGWNVCFSNAATDNPWRQVGWTTMQAEVGLHPEIAEFTVLDAEASDDKQISDIESLAGQGCDALIV